MTSIHQANFKALLLQKLVKRDPIRSRGFHSYCFDLAGLTHSAKRRRSAVKVGNERTLCVPVRGDCNVHFFRTYIDPGGMRVDLLQGIHLNLHPNLSYCLAIACNS